MLSKEKKVFYEECRESGIFDDDQLEIIYKGLVKLSLGQVKVYAREGFNAEQMRQIYLGLEVLPFEQVMIYASDEFDSGQMMEIRLGLETLPISEVMKYAKPEIARISMSSYRMNLQNKLFIKLFEVEPTYLVPSQVCEALRAVKNLPFDKVQEIIDFKDSAREMEIKRMNAELVYYEQLKNQHEAVNSNFNNVRISGMFDMIDDLSSEELDEVVNYINLKAENEVLRNKSLVKSKTLI